MIVGYVLLGFVAVMMFFGLLNGVVKSMKLEPWVALFFIVAFIVGGIIPMISFGTTVSIGIGGFIAPAVLAVVLTILVGFNMDLLRTGAAMLATAAITIAVTLWMPMNTTWLSVLATFVIGLLCGAVSYVICYNRLSSAAGAVGGIVLGNLTAQLILYFTGGSGTIVLGNSVVFDSFVIAMVFAVMLSSVSNRMLIGRTNRAGANVEAAQDNDEESMKDFDDYLND